MRILSNTLFGLAFCCVLLMKVFMVPDGGMGLAVFSILISLSLTHLLLNHQGSLWIPCFGAAVVLGFEMLVAWIVRISLPGTILTFIVIFLMGLAITLAIVTNRVDCAKGKEKIHEI